MRSLLWILSAIAAGAGTLAPSAQAKQIPELVEALEKAIAPVSEAIATTPAPSDDGGWHPARIMLDLALDVGFTFADVIELTLTPDIQLVWQKVEPTP